MKRIIALWGAILLIIGAAGVGYVYWQNSMSADRQNASQKDEVAKSDNNTEATIESADKQPGVYEEYQEGLVASSDGVKLLFFHAPWCPQCRMIEDDIEKQGVPDGVVVLKVDYDSNTALRQKYGVTLQTTFVKVDKDGTELAKFVAYNEPTFDSVKQNLLR